MEEKNTDYFPHHNIRHEPEERKSYLQIENNVPGTIYTCKENATGKVIIKFTTKDYWLISDVDAIVTGIFFVSAVITDVAIVWSFFERKQETRKKLKTIQIGFTSLAFTGLLFEVGWAMVLYYQHGITGNAFNLVCAANIVILVSCILSFLILLCRREGCFDNPCKKEEYDVVAPNKV